MPYEGRAQLSLHSFHSRIMSTQANEYATQLAWWNSPLPTIPNDGQSATLTPSNSHASMDIQNRIAILRRTHLYTHESLRITSILLQPFMPSKSTMALNMLGVDASHRNWSDAVFGGELRIEEESEQYSCGPGVLFSPVENRGKVESSASKRENQTLGGKGRAY